MHFLPITQRPLSRENTNYGLFFIYGMRILTIFGAMKFFNPDFIDFFKELAANNHKDWFDLNRKRYEQSVKKPFAAFTQYMIDVIAKENSDFNDLLAKDCIFRINRDIRFSNDKTPYKTMSSAVIATGGKKSTAINGIYFEFSAEHVRVYGGIYEINKEEIQRKKKEYTPTEEQKKRWARNAYLNKKEKIAKEKAEKSEEANI
jgi:uncharacterized protein (TIGR02453 family)